MTLQTLYRILAAVQLMSKLCTDHVQVKAEDLRYTRTPCTMILIEGS